MESIDLQQRTDEGWKLVAIEWEREVETADNPLLAEVPFGLRISPVNQRLEQDPTEREILLQLMELMVQEGSYAHIADEINRRGFRTRQGTRWTQVSVFEMLPRLIEVGPQLFQSAEWQKRSQEIPKEHWVSAISDFDSISVKTPLPDEYDDNADVTPVDNF
jgi:Recombinase